MDFSRAESKPNLPLWRSVGSSVPTAPTGTVGSAMLPATLGTLQKLRDRHDIWCEPGAQESLGLRTRQELARMVGLGLGSRLLFSSPLNPDFVNSYQCVPQDSGEVAVQAHGALPFVLPATAQPGLRCKVFGKQRLGRKEE